MEHREHPAADHGSVLVGGAQLIDVREPGEVSEGTLEGALNIPLGRLPDRLGELDPARRVVVLCRSGARSRRAAEFLVANDFVDVVNLTGGLLAVGARG